MRLLDEGIGFGAGINIFILLHSDHFVDSKISLDSYDNPKGNADTKMVMRTIKEERLYGLMRLIHWRRLRRDVRRNKKTDINTS